jgi:hypothetical protein
MVIPLLGDFYFLVTSVDKVALECVFSIFGMEKGEEFLSRNVKSDSTSLFVALWKRYLFESFV